MFNFLHRNEAGQHDASSTTSFPIPRRKKSKEEVQRDLFEKLRQDARKQSEQKGVYLDDDVELDKALYQLAASHFQSSYDYWYDNDSTACRPSRLAPNGKVASLVKSRTMRPEDISGIQSYIRTVIAQANLNGEIKERAVQDLTNVARMALNDPLTHGIKWNNQSYSRTFEFLPEEDPDGQRNSIRVDGILVYCNARLKEDDQDVSQCTLYYMAVYYDVTSELVKKRTEFQNEAITRAKEFANSSFRLRSELDLRRALESYGQSLFRMRFEFEYSDDKPLDLAQTLRASDVKRHFVLLSTSESREEFYFDSVKQYLDALQLQDKYNKIKRSAVNNLSRTLVDFAQGATNAQWESKPFDYLYQPPSEELVHTRFSGFIFHYRKKGKTDNDHDVSMTYVFILGVFYESTGDSESN